MIGMKISSQINEGITVFVLDGRLDVNTSPAVEGELLKAVAPDCMLLIDMSKCDYVSSAGLRVLLVIAKQLAKAGANGALLGLVEDVRDVMQMTGFDNIFKNYETFGEAAQALKGAGT